MTCTHIRHLSDRNTVAAPWVTERQRARPEPAPGNSGLRASRMIKRGVQGVLLVLLTQGQAIAAEPSASSLTPSQIE